MGCKWVVSPFVYTILKHAQKSAPIDVEAFEAPGSAASRFVVAVTRIDWWGLTLWLLNIPMEAMAQKYRWFVMIYLFNIVIFHSYVKIMVMGISVFFWYIYIYNKPLGCNHPPDLSWKAGTSPNQTVINMENSRGYWPKNMLETRMLGMVGSIQPTTIMGIS
jgi:hypothetical protein